MIKIMMTRLLEQGINQILAMDPYQQGILKKHLGKVFQLEITDINQSFFFIIREDYLYVYSSYSDTADTCISGTSLCLLRQIHPNNGANTLVIEGDADLAYDIQLLIQGINFNWEEYLSYLTGDFTARRIANIWQIFKTTTGSAKQRFVEDVINYIQEEKCLIPPREEVEDFYEEVAALRHSIDRLEARFYRLTEK